MFDDTVAEADAKQQFLAAYQKFIAEGLPETEVPGACCATVGAPWAMSETMAVMEDVPNKTEKGMLLHCDIYDYLGREFPSLCETIARMR